MTGADNLASSLPNNRLITEGRQYIMATRESYRHIQEHTAALRQISLATVIPIAFPGAAGPTPYALN